MEGGYHTKSTIPFARRLKPDEGVSEQFLPYRKEILKLVSGNHRHQVLGQCWYETNCI